MMMPDMMTGMALTWFIVSLVVLVCLVLVAFVIWQWIRTSSRLRSHQMEHAPQQHDAYPGYEEGYQPPETYQEEEEQSLRPFPQYEQPQAQYPREIPLQH